MIPQQMKKIFGLTSKKDVNMANNIWKMLDQMAQNSPQSYKQFIQKNIKQGVQQVKHKKQIQQKPLKIKPQKGFLLQFSMILNQKPLSNINLSQTQQTKNKISSNLEQKLRINMVNNNVELYQQIKRRFPLKVNILLNVCYSDRVKMALNKNKKQIKEITINHINQIQVLYYSLQKGSSIQQFIKYNQQQLKHNKQKITTKQKKLIQINQQTKSQKMTNNNNNNNNNNKNNNNNNNNNNKIVQLDYCMILNKSLYESLMKQGIQGKKMLMGLSISYFEQRIQTDNNILLQLYNPQQYNKLLFYSVQKFSILLNNQKPYYFNHSIQLSQFLLEKQIDIKRQQQIKKQQQLVKNKLKQQFINKQSNQSIIFKPQPTIKQSFIHKSQPNNKQHTNNYSTINKSQTINKPQPINKSQKTLSKSINQNKQQNSFTQQNNKINQSQQIKKINYNSINQNSNNAIFKQQKKKPLIQVLNQTNHQTTIQEILPYQLKQNDQTYHIEILTPNINSIEQLSLEINDLKIKLKILKTQQKVQIIFKKPINSDLVKAKLKKKTHKLIIDCPFLLIK